MHLPGHSHSTSAFVYHHHDLSGENGILSVLFHSTIRQGEFKKAIPWFPVALMVSVQCCLSATLPFVWCVLPHYNERFFQDHSTFQNRLMARYIDTPARKKLIFPIQNVCNKSEEWFFLLPICFRQVKIKPFWDVDCGLCLWMTWSHRKMVCGTKQLWHIFLLYGKSLLATDMKDTECMFLMGKQHFFRALEWYSTSSVCV